MNKQAEAVVPTEYGSFNFIAYSDREDDQTPHIAIVSANYNPDSPVLVRVHSECMTGDVFHSFKCDCGDQLSESLKAASESNGVVIYLRQEGRGIGIINKLKAYKLQDDGMDTAQANTHLGFETDSRIYNDAIDILKDLKIDQIRLLTNNPEKIHAFDDSGIEVVEKIPLIIPPKKENLRYYETKRDVFGHSLKW